MLIGMIDLVLVLVALLAVWLGWRRGLVTSALTAVGWIAGLLVGLAATPAVLDALDLRPEADNTAALVVVLAALLLAAVGAGVMGALAGMVVRLTNVRPVRLLDSGLGAVALLVTTLLASWAVLASARPLLSADGVRAVDSSYGWRAMDRAAPPAARDALGRFGDQVDASPFPEVFAGREPQVEVEAPDPDVASSPAIARARGAVLKIRSSSDSCAMRSVGSGWVVSENRVVTNAHVIAGGQRITVQPGGEGERHEATVVAFDPDLDLAILRVDTLDAPVLDRAPDLDRGAEAVAAGYPQGGDYTLTAARVRAQMAAVGRDVYGSKPVNRDIYALNAQLLPGDSGGPLLTTDGQVGGTVFARSADDPNTGYALTDDATDSWLDQAGELSSEVPTGDCVAREG